MAAAPVLIVGAGPVGLTLALELARFDVPAVVLDQKPHVEPEGSRAIVVARHVLEIFAGLGCAEPLLAKGVALRRARTYYRDTELFAVDFAPAVPGEIPRFVNIQQTYTERALWERALTSPSVELRWSVAVESLSQNGRGVTLGTSAGDVRGSFAVGCDGARSTVRQLLGVEFPGRTFRDRFLIADVRAELPFPDERRFFFDPPSNPGRQVLIHPQPDGEWRIDWQVPSETDAAAELASGRLEERIRAIAGDAVYELVWLTAYRFHERVAARLRAGRCFLAGDAAHLYAPFGARGLNSGVEDAANLGWKLALVLRGEAGERLLDSYERERAAAARENLRVTSSTMRFIAPPTALHRARRNAVLRGSLRFTSLRRFVDSGLLAEPAVYAGAGPVGRRAPVGGEPLRAGFAAVRREDRLLLVRPDGYVAAELEDPGAIDGALRAAMMAP